MPGLDDVGDLAGQILADPRKFREVRFRRQQASDALRQAFDRAGRAVIGAHAKLVLAFEFQQVGGLIEHRRDFGILYRHRRDLLNPTLANAIVIASFHSAMGIAAP